MLHLASLPKQSCNILQFISRSARQIPSDKELTWSLGVLAPKSVGSVQLGHHTVPLGQTCLSDSTILSAVWTATLKKHDGGSHQSLLAKLGLNPSLYSRHSMCTGGVMTAAAASLSDWEIKSLGHWKSNTYQTYIRETTDMMINCARRMACAPASITFNYSWPYPVKNNLWWTVLPAICLPIQLVQRCPKDSQDCSVSNHRLVMQIHSPLYSP